MCISIGTSVITRKIILDEVFGLEQFTNEVVWKRAVAKTLMSVQLPNNHDVMFLYQKGNNAVWNSETLFLPYDEDKLDEKTASKYVHRDEAGRLYRLDNLINPNQDRPNLKYEFLGVTRVLALDEGPNAGKDPLKILTISPDPEKADMDIRLPQLSAVLVRKKSLADEIAALDLPKLRPALPKKDDAKEARDFKYEGIDFITLKKVVERDYKIPAPQTAEEVIGYYARRIAQDVKLPTQFAALVPKGARVPGAQGLRRIGGPLHARDGEGDREQRRPLCDGQDVRGRAARQGR